MSEERVAAMTRRASPAGVSGAAANMRIRPVSAAGRTISANASASGMMLLIFFRMSNFAESGRGYFAQQ